MTRILVCGCRYWYDRDGLRAVLEQARDLYGEFTLINGACPYGGADKHAHEIALELEMVSISVPAKFKTLGKSAGPRRNEYMLEKGKPDLILAFHPDIKNSRGTFHMVKIGRKAGITIVIFDGASPYNLKEALDERNPD